MTASIQNGGVPHVVFAFKRPDHLGRVLESLRAQSVKKLIVYIDGPKCAADIQRVDACKRVAGNIDWTDADLRFADTNGGLSAIAGNITDVMNEHPSAIFLEDDCLPMPGFNEFMCRSLAHYRDDERVFSICGYQPIAPRFFRGYAHSLVSSPRFLCWGWATWRDRWERILSHFDKCQDLFDGLSNVPDAAGLDLAEAARSCTAGRLQSWAIKVALVSLWLEYVHLQPTCGLVRNIGVGDGEHGIFSGTREMRLQNRNVATHPIENIRWLEDTSVDMAYAAALRQAVVAGTRGWSRWKKFRRRIEMGVRRRTCDFVRVCCPSCLRAVNRLHERLWPASKERFYGLVLEDNGQELNKRALVSYITRPFTIPRNDPRFLHHMNIWFAHGIVRALNREGYAVDVVDCGDRKFTPTREYDVAVLTGGRSEAYAAALTGKTTTIFFAAGKYWRVANELGATRFEALRSRRGTELPRDRLFSSEEAGESTLRNADGVIVLGNHATSETYSSRGPILTLDGVALPDDHYDEARKDFSIARNHFLYFAGAGCVHKGLDLLLEVFSQAGEHLWICSHIEEEFEALYIRELSDCPNIHRVGWVQPRSEEYYSIIDRCQYVILPSCSEGQAQSVVECMGQGLVPIVSGACGIDVDGLGTRLDNCSIDEIRQVVERMSTRSAEECRRESGQVRRSTMDQYTEEKFIRNFGHAVQMIVAARSEGE